MLAAGLSLDIWPQRLAPYPVLAAALGPDSVLTNLTRNMLYLVSEKYKWLHVHNEGGSPEFLK